MRTNTSLCAVGLFLCAGLVHPAYGQTTWHVDDDASAGGDGATWSTAYKYLADAFSSATGGDEILVAGGTYTPDQDEAGNVTPGDRTATLQLSSGVSVIGGYRGLAGGGDGDDRDTALFETILSGDLDADDNFGGDNTENSYQVVTGSGASATAQLSGFTITAGNADGPDAFPLFRDRGGGMFIYRGSPTVTDCIFSDNSAALGGGGLNNEESSPKLINCVFRGNNAGFSGGGMRGWMSGPTLFNCVFTGNAAEFGGAAWHGASTAAYTNCTFSNNAAPLGNALGFDSCCPASPSGVTLTNCILWDDGDEIRNFDGSTITITYSDVQDEDANDGTVYPGAGNIDDDPLFVDADGPDDAAGTEDDDLNLSAGSPAIDAADNTAVPFGVTTDLNGDPRFVDDPPTPDTGNGAAPIVDMGAYEFLACGNGVVDPGEECDDEDANSDITPDACRTDCSQAGCGDGVVDSGEECDDGDTELGDGCNESCRFETGACCVATACSTPLEADCLSSGGVFFGFLSVCDAPDADGDGLRDQCDNCWLDSNKIEPGVCGCGVADLGDEDSDGILDCLDRCPGLDDMLYAPLCIVPVPTVSELGLVILALLLLMLVAGEAYISRPL